MSKTHVPVIRTLLRKEPDGLTLVEIASTLAIDIGVARNAIKRMPDAYIDRWQLTQGGPPSAVWCVVVPPENCPHPWRSKPSNTTGAQA